MAPQCRAAPRLRRHGLAVDAMSPPNVAVGPYLGRAGRPKGSRRELVDCRGGAPVWPDVAHPAALGGWCFSRRGGPPASLIVSGESWWLRGRSLGVVDDAGAGGAAGRSVR